MCRIPARCCTPTQKRPGRWGFPLWIRFYSVETIPAYSLWRASGSAIVTPGSGNANARGLRKRRSVESEPDDSSDSDCCRCSASVCCWIRVDPWCCLDGCTPGSRRISLHPRIQTSGNVRRIARPVHRVRVRRCILHGKRFSDPAKESTPGLRLPCTSETARLSLDVHTLPLRRVQVWQSRQKMCETTQKYMPEWLCGEDGVDVSKASTRVPGTAC